MKLFVAGAATPIEPPETLKPERLWRVGGDDESDILFGVLTHVTSDDDGNIYALDAQLNEVMIFSSGGDYLRSVGRQGQGPGEFQRPADLFLTAGGNVAVLQRMPGKIILLGPDGAPAGNYPLPEFDGMRMFSGGRRSGDDVVVAVQRFKRKDNGLEVESELVRLDGRGQKVATYHTRSASRDFANMVVDEKTLGRCALEWTTDDGGRVYTSDDFDAYSISVFNAAGELERVIEREYESRNRSAAEMEQNTPRLMIRRGNRTERPESRVSKTDRDIQRIFAREDGTLWVLSSRGGFDAPEGTIATFDVFDRDGRFARQVSLRGQGSFVDDGFHLVRNRLYVVTGLRSAQRAMFGGDDEEKEEITDAEPMSIICYDMGPVVQTRK
ncbi:MAG: 6-bladed beta-propeller [Candidatus Krumholzibacteriia bacterium]